MATRFLLAAIATLGFVGLIPAVQAQTAAPAAPVASGPVALRGAGATFPAPLYQKWIDIYTKANPSLAIEYQAVGSGEGVKRFLENSVDFGGSDAALSDEQIAKAPGGATLVPATAGAIVLAYNLPDVKGALKLSREVYADIFLGRIRNWNDPKIQTLNPDLKLPNQTITLVARQDSSGTTYAMTNHLSAISATWRNQGPGVGKVIDWPGISMVAPGNEGVAGRIKRSWGSIGYVEYGFAKRLGLPMVHLENKAGRYIEPGLNSGQAALAANISQIPGNLRVFLPDPEGDDSYPIVTFTWLLLHDRYPNPQKSTALKGFVNWALIEGQSYSSDMGYIPLPADVVALARVAVDRVQ
ncbi:phosphate ABC transporter substrate-binding protein PstS [Candidatus Contendibacter odensensis]|uniref:Phosphate-binding protein PstS n=1 Tax=Candidatus Contendobacter odensis Run_B_J11 TaxID=1400861 RepID=A0A7U7J2G1_9GAMM|nr:phosphate ABC transporter substrate-binding protein PstS [Candidatus Contendobacter odensis]MBK8752124.1 phosphate ABC transporter substrate-binding protein PstS [Candidatus Competibacteraceae bacterium]CDH43119.1 Phosphate ABC transporter, periplasmic phosphate-binding protein [Candidatus Contendobacter odensis Run_B_J11]